MTRKVRRTRAPMSPTNTGVHGIAAAFKVEKGRNRIRYIPAFFVHGSNDDGKFVRYFYIQKLGYAAAWDAALRFYGEKTNSEVDLGVQPPDKAIFEKARERMVAKGHVISDELLEGL